MTIDVKYFYSNTPIARSECMRLQLSNLLESVVKQYNLEAKSTKDCYVYVEIKQGMYGLPQEGLIAQEMIEKLLNKKSYKQSDITLGFWMHN